VEVLPVEEIDEKLLEEAEEEIKKAEKIPAKVKTWIRYLEQELDVARTCADRCDVECVLDAVASGTTWRHFAIDDAREAVKKGLMDKEAYYTVYWTAITLRNKLIDEAAEELRKKCIIRKK